MTSPIKNPDTIYFTRLHWIIFLAPVLFFLAVVSVAYYVEQLRTLGYVLILFSLAWIGVTWVNYYFSSLTIKKNQVILRTGILVRQTIDMPLNKIEAIDIRQSILGSILRYGMLSITGTGGTRRVMNYLNNPLTCRRHIEHLMAVSYPN